MFIMAYTRAWQVWYIYTQLGTGLVYIYSPETRLVYIYSPLLYMNSKKYKKCHVQPEQSIVGSLNHCFKCEPALSLEFVTTFRHWKHHF